MSKPATPAFVRLSMALMLASSAGAAESFRPTQPDPLTEPWRWTSFDPFKGRNFEALAEAADGSVWLGIADRVVHFDGLKQTAYGSAEGVAGGPLRSLLVAKTGHVYALTRTHFLRFDGARWTTLAEVANDGPRGNRLREAADGGIWALTPKELLCYAGENLARFAEWPAPLSNFTIDGRNQLWLALQGGAVWQIPLAEAGLGPRDQWARHNVYSTGRRIGQFSLLSARDGTIWIVSAADSGVPVARFDSGEGKWHHLDLKSHGGTNKIFSLAEGGDGTIWLAGWGRLQAIRPSGIAIYLPSEIENLPFHWYSIHALQNETLWFCGSLLHRIDCSNRQWDTLTDLGFQCQGPDGHEWFVSRDNRIVVHDPKRETWLRFDASDGLMDLPVGVVVSREGVVWAAGSDKGDAAIARLEGNRWRLDRHPKFARGIARQSLYESLAGDMYFGAEFERNASPGRSGGLLRYRREGGTWAASNIGPPATPFRVITIAEDDEGAFWFGGDRLARMKQGRAVAIPAPVGRANVFSQVSRDPVRGGVWICEWGGGVYYYSRGKLQHYGEQAGLSSHLISAVSISPTGETWAAAQRALSRFDGTRWAPAGLPPHFGVDLGPSHLRIANDGAVWVVTILDSWYEPAGRESAATADRRKRATLQSFRYRPERDPPETRLQSTVTEISEKQSATFLWQGSARWSGTSHEALHYSYRVDAGEWSPFSKATHAVVPNLPPGKHTFEVRARDRDLNVDPTPAVAPFAVIPSIWRQPWFLALLAAFVATITLLLWLLVRLRIRHIVQLGELKLQFFTNISHELRTPLTAILGPLARLQHEAREPKVKQRLEIIRQNAARMLQLVDQILDFRRVQLRAAPPAPESTELVSFLRAQRERLQGYAEDKAIRFDFSAHPEEFHGLVDRDMLIKIVDNLISNAIKYTPPGGEIALVVDCISASAPQGKYELKLCVSDSGVGIASDDRQRIFDLFYRASAAKSLPAPGAGIGLTLTKELIEQCGGTIAVESPVFPPAKPACGSRFTVTIPVERKREPPHVICGGPASRLRPAGYDAAEASWRAEASAEAAARSADDAEFVPRENSHAPRSTVLLIEDNPDIRRLLRDELEDAYVVLEAEDGATGLRLAEAHSADCVISDVMMPGLSGEEVCVRLKANELTSHIPVILLTARSSTASQARGWQAGADDYVVKPVSFALLRLRLENVLKARATMREKFSREVYLAPSDVAVTPRDEQFIRRAMRIVEEHMDDPEFDVETFARAMGLSRASLFRKFKALSGNTPRDFIRDMRLERARQLLATGQVNVSETVARVGFSDLSHFGACFRKKFGETPSDFAARTKSAQPVDVKPGNAASV